MDDRQTTRVQRAIKMQAVPPEKWQQMVGRTVLGLLFVGLGLVSALVLDWGKWPSIGLTIFGATIWSTQIITNTLMALLAPFRAFLSAWRSTDKGDGGVQ